MEQVKKFINDQLNKVDIDKQREVILTQSDEIQKQTERIMKLFSESSDIKE